MATLKQDLDEYLLLQSDQKKSTSYNLPKFSTPSVFTNIFRRQEPEANSWIKETQDSCCPRLTRLQRILGFIICMGLGCFCFGLSALYIPVLILKARKFALLYTLGSVFFILSFSFLSGFVAMLRQMFSKERLIVSICYIGSLAATLYFALWMQSTALTVVFAVVQVISLLMMVMNAVPGGASGVKFFTSMFKSSVSNTLPV